MRLRLDVRLEADPSTDHNAWGNLQLSESITINAATFLEVAGILGRFHDLGLVVQHEQIAGAPPAAAAPGDAGEGPDPPPAPPAPAETV